MKLEICDVSKQYKDKCAVDHANLTLTPGVWGLLGANGAGKTTLMRMIAGIMKPTGGEIRYDGIEIDTLGEKYRDIFGYLPQEFGFYPGFSVQDYLEYMAALKGIGKKETKEKIQELLEIVSLTDVRKKKIVKLSGGMKRRVGIAQALLGDPEILVLDEPTNDLDIVTLGILEEYLQAFRGCVIVVSHDRYFVDKVADHLLVFCGGGEIRDFAGTYSEYVAWKREYEAARRAEAAQARPKPQAAKTQAAKTQAAEAVPRKLSFNEKRELEALETEIPALEAEKAALEASLSSGTLPVEELTAQSRRIAELIASIDEKTMRWLELSER